MTNDVHNGANDDSRFSLSVFLLNLLAIVTLLATVAGAIAIFNNQISHKAPMDVGFTTKLLGATLGGVGLAGLLMAMAAMVRNFENIAHSVLAANPHSADDPLVQNRMHGENGRVLASTNGSSATSDLGHMHDLLREIRDLSVVSPTERDSSLERIRTNYQKHAAEEIIEAVNRRQLGDARIMLRDAEATYGSTSTFERLSVKIEEAEARTEPLDFARTKRMVEEAIAGKRWAEAEQFVEDLSHNHPASVRCRQLWEDTRRARLLAHVQRCSSQHHWAEAKAAANEFLERFPDGVEAKALRLQLATLEDNAEIVQRRHIESRITELLASQHFDEALRLAKHVVENFPDSPQAEALREQLPRLEKRVTA